MINLEPVTGTKFWAICESCDKLKLFGTTAKGDLGFREQGGIRVYCDRCAKEQQHGRR